MSDWNAIIADNVARVRQRIAEAASRVGRRADDVQLVAVTKYVDVEVIRAVVRAGCVLLGESRPQPVDLVETFNYLIGLKVARTGEILSFKVRLTETEFRKRMFAGTT